MSSFRPVDILARHRTELKAMGVKSLAIFGSVARGEAGPGSDIDILVELARPMGLLDFIRLRYRLEGMLGRRVDLVTPKALKRQLRDRIVHEAQDAGQGLEI